MYFIDSKFGNCPVATLKTKQNLNYTVITVITTRKSGVNLCTNNQEQMCKRLQQVDEVQWTWWQRTGEGSVRLVAYFKALPL